MSICFFRPRRRSVNIQTTELFFSVFVGTVGVSWRAWLLIFMHHHAYSGNISNRIKTVNSCRPLFLKNYHYIPLAIILWRVSSPKHDTCCVWFQCLCGKSLMEAVWNISSCLTAVKQAARVRGEHTWDISEHTEMHPHIHTTFPLRVLEYLSWAASLEFHEMCSGRRIKQRLNILKC